MEGLDFLFYGIKENWLTDLEQVKRNIAQRFDMVGTYMNLLTEVAL